MYQIHVIIPVYNAKPYLKETVDSVLNQPYMDIDIILVDDGSTDGSGALCDTLAAESSRVSVIHQENAGVSAARNAGIETVLETIPPFCCANHYFAFLDSDDLWYPNAIPENFQSIIQQYEQNDLLAFGSVYANHLLTRFSCAAQSTQYHCAEGSRSIWTFFGHFGACLYPVSIFREYHIRFLPGLAYSEDKIFLMQSVFLSEHIHFHPIFLHIYRGTPGSAVRKIKKIPAIDYYLPIIDAWVQSDLFINSLESKTGKSIKAGHVLAGIYLLEMSGDHLTRGGSRKKLLELLHNHPHFDLLKNMRQQDVSPAQYRNSRLLLNSPVLFQIKCIIEGFPIKVLSFLRKMPLLHPLENRIKFPLTSLPPQGEYHVQKH